MIFFIQNTRKFDMIFIDANHNIDYVISDFENSIKIINKSGCVILHDTDPEKEYLKDPGYCSDAYKIRNYLDGKYDFVTLPILECGLTIVRNKGDYRS